MVPVQARGEKLRHRLETRCGGGGEWKRRCRVEQRNLGGHGSDGGGHKSRSNGPGMAPPPPMAPSQVTGDEDIPPLL